MALRPCKECKQQISSDAKVCPHCGKKVGMSTGAGCLVIIGLLILVGYIPRMLRQPGDGDGSASVINQRDTALSQIKLDYKWRTAGFGSVMEADFIVKNDSNYNIKDFEITCRHFAKSGTEIDSNKRQIFDVVKAHSTKKFLKFNMGFIHSQAASSSCQITDLSIAP